MKIKVERVNKLINLVSGKNADYYISRNGHYFCSGNCLEHLREDCDRIMCLPDKAAEIEVSTDKTFFI